MLNKLKSFLREQNMLLPGDRVVCAVSGGADSMALLWALYLLKDKLDIRLSVAHFNHGLRGVESDRDAAFVQDFCNGYGIPFTAASAQVTAGEKGLEAAAREARYAFLKSLPGKIATAHTADDNAETVLMHLVRGTGLKGLGGITPVNGKLIRPMLRVTRLEVLVFLEEYHIPYVEDSSNREDHFLRNRLRHHVLPLLKKENPSLSENLTAMALRLREDDQALCRMAKQSMTCKVSTLRTLEPAVRSRVFAEMLLKADIKEPESAHIQSLEKLVFSENPSAKAVFSGGVTFCRCYDDLQVSTQKPEPEPQTIAIPGATELPAWGLRITCRPNDTDGHTVNSFPVVVRGTLQVRSRRMGDAIRLSGGTKSLKKLFIDRKIPASERDAVAVLADAEGIVAVAGIGANLDRIVKENNAVRIEIEYL